MYTTEEFQKVAIGLVIGMCAGILTATLYKPELFTKVETITVTEYIVKKQDTKKNKKTTEVTKKPDGTIITKTTDEQKDTTSVTDTKTNGTTTVSTVPNMLKYSLGANIVLSRTMLTEFDYKTVTINAGVRLGNTPIWLEGGYRLDNTILLGVKIEL